MQRSAHGQRPPYGIPEGPPSLHAIKSIPLQPKKEKERVVKPEGEEYPRLLLHNFIKRSGLLVLEEGAQPIHVFNYSYPNGRSYLFIGDRNDRLRPSPAVMEAMEKLRPYLKGEKPLENGGLLPVWSLTPVQEVQKK